MHAACVLGEFNRFSQHLNYGGVVWEEQKGVCESKQADLELELPRFHGRFKGS